MTTACYDEYHDQSGGCVFALVAGAVIALVIGIGIFKWAATTDTDLPLTRHAQTSHASQKWNAVTINEYMRTSGCQVKEYLCPNGTIKVRYCQNPDNPELSLGLFVGAEIEQIISGFTGRESYWKNRGECQ